MHRYTVDTDYLCSKTQSLPSYDCHLPKWPPIPYGGGGRRCHRNSPLFPTQPSLVFFRIEIDEKQWYDPFSFGVSQCMTFDLLLTVPACSVTLFKGTMLSSSHSSALTVWHRHPTGLSAIQQAASVCCVHAVFLT